MHRRVVRRGRVPDTYALPRRVDGSCHVVFLPVLRHNRRAISTSKNSFSKTLAIILLAVGVLAAFSPKIYKRVTSRDRGAAQARVSQYYVAAEIITTHPIIGVGINNYVEVMENYDETTSRISRGFKFPIHTVYLEYYAETGLLGITALLSFFLIIVITGVKNIARARGFLFSLNAGLFFGFIAYGIHAISDMNYPSRLTVFAFFAAMFTITNYAIRDRITLIDG